MLRHTYELARLREEVRGWGRERETKSGVIVGILNNILFLRRMNRWIYK